MKRKMRSVTLSGISCNVGYGRIAYRIYPSLGKLGRERNRLMKTIGAAFVVLCCLLSGGCYTVTKINVRHDLSGPAASVDVLIVR